MLSQKFADSVMKRTSILTELKEHSHRWSYEFGLTLKGIEAVWWKTGEQKYFNFIKENMDVFIDKDGTIGDYTPETFNIDFINNGKPAIMLYKETGEQHYKIAIDTLRHQLEEHPTTSEGVYWHKLMYPHQIWLDGLYMEAPFFAEYTKEFGKEEDFTHIINQFLICAKNTKDEKTGLLYHAFDESKQQPWCDPETGKSKNFWGRGMGWFVMGIVDVLPFIPTHRPNYQTLIDLLEETLEALVKVQDKSGVWYQVLDKGDEKGNYLESSASCMILYAIAKGIRLGYLDKKWLDIAKKAYEGIISEFVLETEDGLMNLNKVCQVAGLGGSTKRDGSYAYYLSEPVVCNDLKGVGAMILAASEMESLGEFSN